MKGFGVLFCFILFFIIVVEAIVDLPKTSNDLIERVSLDEIHHLYFHKDAKVEKYRDPQVGIRSIQPIWPFDSNGDDVTLPPIITLYDQMICKGDLCDEPDLFPETIHCFQNLRREWRCEANLAFDSLFFDDGYIVCERFYGPSDNWIVNGSCHIEYSLYLHRKSATFWPESKDDRFIVIHVYDFNQPWYPWEILRMSQRDYYLFTNYPNETNQTVIEALVGPPFKSFVPPKSWGLDSVIEGNCDPWVNRCFDWCGDILNERFVIPEFPFFCTQSGFERKVALLVAYTLNRRFQYPDKKCQENQCTTAEWLTYMKVIEEEIELQSMSFFDRLLNKLF